MGVHKDGLEKSRGMKAMISYKLATKITALRCHLKKLKPNILTPSGNGGNVISYKAKNEKCEYGVIYYT